MARQSSAVAISCARLAPARAWRRFRAAPLATEAQADTENDDDKRKARYKANSAHVKTYYRVNSYPS